MKKFILPLLVLLFVGSLFAVESDPSEVVGYVKYDCVAGLNFVALPMDDGLTTTAEVGNVYNADNDKIDVIYMWDIDLQDWYASTNYGGGFWDPELPVSSGSVLFFNTTEAFSFYSIGPMPASPAQYSIVAGLNTAMIPLNRSDLTLTSEVGASIGTGEDVDVIYLWDSSLQDWSAATNYGGGFWDPELSVTIASPMFFNSVAPSSWPSRSSNNALRSRGN